MLEKYNIPEPNSLDSMEGLENKEADFERLGFKSFELNQETELNALLRVIRHKNFDENFIQSDLQDWVKRQNGAEPIKLEDLEKIEKIPDGTVVYALGSYTENHFVSRQLVSVDELGSSLTYYMPHVGADYLTYNGNDSNGRDVIIKWKECILPYRNSTEIGKIKWLEKLTYRGIAEDRYPELRFVKYYIRGKAGVSFFNDSLHLVEDGGGPSESNDVWVHVEAGKSVNGEKLLNPFLNQDDMPKNSDGERLFNGVTSELGSGLYLPIGSHILFKK